MIPGWIEFTFTPYGPSSCAAPLVMPRTAHFVAAYAKHALAPRRPPTDEMLTMAPERCSVICAATACIPRNTPVWFTATTSFQVSSDVSTIRCQRRIPALFTRMSSASVFGDDLIDECRPLVLSGDVVLDERAADLGRGLRALVGEHVGEVDDGALLREQPTLGGALPTRASGDHGHPSVELPHTEPPCSPRFPRSDVEGGGERRADVCGPT